MARILRNSFSTAHYILHRGVSLRPVLCAHYGFSETFSTQAGNEKARLVSFLGSYCGLQTNTCYYHTTSSSKIISPSLKNYGGFKSLASASAAVDVSSTSFPLKEAIETIQHYGQCFLELSKVRLSMLVVATSGAGFVLGGPETINWASLFWTCTGTMMVAASANAFNQVIEIKNDSLMKRTMRRPLPSGRLSKCSAIIWATSMGAIGSMVLASEANYLAAGLALTNLALYTLVYTPLKQLHPINTWVGAVVGAIPPLIGWASAVGEVTLEGLVLPLVLYFWQIPHFMALAYLCQKDYADGGFKMLSLSDVAGKRTSLAALRNCLYLLPLGFLSYDWSMTSMWFGIETTLLNSGIGAAALLFYLNRCKKNARRLFHASLLYLPLFMAGMLFHRIPKSHQDVRNTACQEDDIVVAKITHIDEQRDEDENVVSKHSQKVLQRSPIAYASVAPFPFLPVPMFRPDEQ